MPLPGVLQRLLRPPPPVVPELPPGERLYCIGDIHGRSDLLLRLHELIRADAAGCGATLRAIYLGDYVDRGPDSRGVIELLLGDPLPQFQSIFLRGNHEQAMLDYLFDPQAGGDWLFFGGQATLLSYGVALRKLPVTREEHAALRRELEEQVPEAHLDFLRATRNSHQLGSYFFVHAGVRPGVPLERQHPADLLWIRNGFIESRQHYGKIVVHGHTIEEPPQLRPNRIGIDTGAYASDRLTCLVLEEAGQRFLHT